MKKFLSLVLALSMVLALVACGGNNKPANDTQTNNQTQTDDKTTPETPETRPNRLIYGSTTEISGDLGNAWWTNNATDKLIRGLIDDYNLITFDPDGAMVINETVCGGIDAVENEDGSKTFTIKINEGLKYNNGEPIFWSPTPPPPWRPAPALWPTAWWAASPTRTARPRPSAACTCPTSTP